MFNAAFVGLGLSCHSFSIFFSYIILLQQFEVIKFQTELKVEEYYGDKGVDQWDSKTWEKEIAEHDVSWFHFCFP